MIPSNEQLLAIETQDRPLVVEAGAGTGKTWVLVQRFINLLDTHPDWSLDSILAITFTEKAAREMRSRVRQAIEDKARVRQARSELDTLWQDHRLNLDRLQISTIHSLCARILRENAITAEIDPRFQVLDEQEADLLKEQAVREIIQILDEEDHPALELLASLRVSDLHKEMEAMLEKRGTLYQLFRDLEEPDELISRWEAGLAEMREALWQTQIQEYPDLLDRCAEILDIPITDPNDNLAPSVQTAQEGAVDAKRGEFVEAGNHWVDIKRRGGQADNWGGKDAKDYLLNDLLKPLQDVAKNLKKQNFLVEMGSADQEAAQHLWLWCALWERLDLTYSQIKEAQQALDFDDLELLTDRLLHKMPFSHRLQGFLKHINHLMVDEFQDTNHIQQRIVYALAPLQQSGKIFVVGDAKQSIYRFRQAQVSIFNRTSAEIEEITGSPPLVLSTSFRTHHRLVSVANSLFEEVFSPLGDAYAPFEAKPGPLNALRDTRPELSTPIEILLLPAKDQQGENISAEDGRIWEAQWIAQRLIELKELHAQVWDKDQGIYRPFEYRDAAVLFRATTQLPLYEDEFKRAGLPYLTVSGRGYYDRPEVQDLISLLSALANPADDLNMAAALRSPLFSMSDETLYRLRWHSQDGKRADDPISFREALSHPPINDQTALVGRANTILSELWMLTNRVAIWTLLREALDLTSFEVALAKYDGQSGRQLSNVQKFLSLAREMSDISLAEFLGRIRHLKAREAREGEALGREPESGAVQLMSIHAAKGLEFPVVVLADMGRQERAGFGSPYLLHDPAYGLVCKVRDEMGDWKEPAGYAWGKWLNGRMEKAERKRLLYVACTRAAEMLILSGQLGKKNTWLTEILAAWGIEEEGLEEEILNYDYFSIQVFRPEGPLEIGDRVSEEVLDSPKGMEAIPVLAQPIPAEPQPLPVAVTRLEQLLGRKEDDLAELRPAIWRNERPTTVTSAPGYLVGNIVHRALAHWDCLEYSQGALAQLIESFALREGVFSDALDNAVNRSLQMLLHLKKHAIYEEIREAQQRYHEVPFTLTTTPGTLHGVIDLLYQDQGGNWHLLDWKTEWSPHEIIEENALQHLTQMAAYSSAIQQSLGKSPVVGLCFLFPRVVHYLFSEEELNSTWVMDIPQN